MPEPASMPAPTTQPNPKQPAAQPKPQTTGTSRISTSGFQSGTPGYYSERDSAYQAYPGPYHHYPNQDRLQAAQAQASTSNLSTPSRYPDNE
ncbi:hypothetical protein VKT23_010967 [Stygiomarasmius scandens]|uniref:Uncharacterized protein n=1 Tax=Marasmiellus scandens TaxID=2682957 RepID=A0ABR1J9I2_9AGAR